MENDMNKGFREFTEEELQKINGGISNEELVKQYQQPDGTYKYVCPVCGDVIVAKTADEMVEKLMQDMDKHLGGGFNPNIPVPNLYKG